MSEKPKFSMPNQSKKPTKEKEVKEESHFKQLFAKKIVEEKSTRSIRFVKRGVVTYLTYFFWLLFVFSLFLNMIAYGRYGYLIQKVNQKEVDPQEIVADLNSSKEKENVAKYESQQFITQLFTYSQDNKEQRTEYLESKLANGLTENMLTSTNSKAEQTVKTIEFVDSEMTSYDEGQYRFIFDVTVATNDKQKKIQLSLPISIKNKDFKVINYPTYLNIERSDNLEKNSIVYQERTFLTEGEKLEQDQKRALESFTQDFFSLYVGNEDSLKLISNVKGIDNATLKSLQIRNVVKKDKYYVVEGTFNISYEENNVITSFFSLTIEKTKDTYFVSKIN